ncbi:prepilin peptidase [Amycolatopsis sp. YIM 10]|uniref:prepilin peptidase n=1 Tax=Amycolatopsis sp. YIM 10 TaxID=2653857 RepID=UPI0012906765|nr:prepilin peptidase [Amycolatopsis sp. YIM 10]QFU86710.1 Type IV leader peptidase family protein [Amycolatopsis sp. YIM 10]
MQFTASGWWCAGAVVTGAVFGAGASALTRRFLRHDRALAGSWWLGAVMTAAVLGALAWRVGPRGELAVYGVVAVLAVPLSVIDWCEHRLPRALVLPQLAGVLAGFAVLCVVRGDFSPGLRVLGAAVAAAGLFLVLAVVSSGGVGAGDVNAAAVVGAVTAWAGWPQVAWALVVALALALLLVLALRRELRFGSQADKVVVPFGPCLFAGALLVLVTSG